MRHDEVIMLAENRSEARSIPMYPLISQITGGISGVWAIAAETGGGKTTLARHLAYSVVGPDLRVAYLDTEGHFLNKDANAGIMTCHGDGLRERARDYMTVFQDSSDFRAHVDVLPTRTLIVVDHVQLEAERRSDGGDPFQSIDGVMASAVDWANAGHLVLVLSQVSRASYGTKPPTKAIFKGRSSIEQAATIGAALWRPEKDNDNLIQFRVVKTRFVPMPDQAVDMLRVGWSLREVGLRHVGRTTGTTKVKLTPVQKAFAGRERETLTNLDILQALKKLKRGRSTGERWIAEAVAAGQIERALVGHYRLVTTNGAAA
jgi:hypothetical protein